MPGSLEGAPHFDNIILAATLVPIESKPTLIAMLVLLCTLIVTYLLLGTGRTAASMAETWAACLPRAVRGGAPRARD